MKRNLNLLTEKMKYKNYKVVRISKSEYELENGDIFEHTFDIDENITVNEFQQLLDNAKSVIIETLDKIESKI